MGSSDHRRGLISPTLARPFSGACLRAFAAAVDAIAYAGEACADVISYRIEGFSHSWPGALGVVPRGVATEPPGASSIPRRHFQGLASPYEMRHDTGPWPRRTTTAPGAELVALTPRRTAQKAFWTTSRSFRATASGIGLSSCAATRERQAAECTCASWLTIAAWRWRAAAGSGCAVTFITCDPPPAAVFRQAVSCVYAIVGSRVWSGPASAPADLLRARDAYLGCGGAQRRSYGRRLSDPRAQRQRGLLRAFPCGARPERPRPAFAEVERQAQLSANFFERRESARVFRRGLSRRSVQSTSDAEQIAHHVEGEWAGRVDGHWRRQRRDADGGKWAFSRRSASKK